MTHPRLVRALLVLLLAAPAAAQHTSTLQHPAVALLTGEGVMVDGARVTLLPPLATPDMPADQQRQALVDLVGERRLEKYLQDSVVASYKLDIANLGKTDSRATVRRLDLYFVVHGNLSIIHEKQLLGGLMNNDKTAEAAADTGFETYAKPLDESQEEEERELPPAGVLSENAFKYRFPILERVVVSGLARSAGMHVEGALVQSAVTPQDLVDDPANPTQWRLIPRGVESDAGLAPPEPFTGFQCYLHATQLGFIDNAVLIECHAAYVEPYGWFKGRNLLASKLPILMQHNIREFRRKLKETQAEQQ